MLARPGGGIDAVLGETFAAVESAAGGLDKLRGEVRMDRRGEGRTGRAPGADHAPPRLAGMALGVDPELPLTARQAYAAVCVAAADVPTSVVEAEPLRRFLMARARTGLAAGPDDGSTTGAFDLSVPFVDSSGRAAWFGFGGVAGLAAGPAATGGGLDFVTVGTSATVRSKWKAGVDLSRARRLEIDAALTPPQAHAAAPTTATLLVHFQDFEQPDSPSRNRAMHLAWPADGTPRRASIDLADYPWLARARPTVGLALAPRGVPPGTQVTVTALRFR